MSETAPSPAAALLSSGAARGRALAVAASVARAAAVWQAIHRAILAALHAHARRHVALALGERVTELNQAIRTGAEARQRLESEKENQK